MVRAPKKGRRTCPPWVWPASTTARPRCEASRTTSAMWERTITGVPGGTSGLRASAMARRVPRVPTRNPFGAWAPGASDERLVEQDLARAVHHAQVAVDHRAAARGPEPHRPRRDPGRGAVLGLGLPARRLRAVSPARPWRARDPVRARPRSAPSAGTRRPGRGRTPVSFRPASAEPCSKSAKVPPRPQRDSSRLNSIIRSSPST